MSLIKLDHISLFLPENLNLSSQQHELLSHFSFSSGSEPANDAANIIEMGLGNWSKDPGSELTFQFLRCTVTGGRKSWALPNQISFQEVAKQKESPHKILTLQPELLTWLPRVSHGAVTAGEHLLGPVFCCEVLFICLHLHWGFVSWARKVESRSWPLRLWCCWAPVISLLSLQLPRLPILLFVSHGYL